MLELNKVFIHEKVWQQFSDDEMNQYIQLVFDYYRNIRGFPHFEYSKEKNIKKFKKLCEYNTESLIVDKNIKQTMHGLDIAWSYFPHVWDIQQGDCLTPMQVFNDDNMLVDAIKRRIALGDAMSDNMMRKVLCIYKNCKRVSNFRPTASSAIYKHFNGKIVYDMSAGFGGRLLGAMSCGNVKRYYGVEPSTQTYNGLTKMISDLKDYFLGEPFIHKIGSEDFITPELVDIAFTSPPYFDTEKYSDEPTQSYIKFPTYEEWINGFLHKTFNNCYKSLKNNGWLIINIANTKKYKELEKDTIKTAIKSGFIYKDTYYLLLSQVSKAKGYKTEPVFIFQK